MTLLLSDYVIEYTLFFQRKVLHVIEAKRNGVKDKCIYLPGFYFHLFSSL